MTLTADRTAERAPARPAGAMASIDSLPVDMMAVADRLPQADRDRLDRLRAFLDSTVAPAVGPYWDREEFPFDLLPALAEQGLGEVLLTTENRLLRGLIWAELTRVDVSLSAFIGIHNELVLGGIDTFGSPEQKEKWLPGLRNLTTVGCFALTEPEHGSDVAGGLTTTARRTDKGWVVNGAKRWIGGGTFADFAIVFAKDADTGRTMALVVEADRPGFTATKICGKTGLRIMQNADMVFDDVLVPLGNALPGVTSWPHTNVALRESRAWVGWQAAGLQVGMFEVARRYALERVQFGKPLAKFQLVQQKLAEMASNASASLSLMAQVAWLQEQGRMDMPHAAMAKATCTRLARESATLGRSLLGGNGIVSQYTMARMFNDAEVLHTYEGTYNINSLIVGRALTGVSAFV